MSILSFQMKVIGRQTFCFNTYKRKVFFSDFVICGVISVNPRFITLKEFFDVFFPIAATDKLSGSWVPVWPNSPDWSNLEVTSNNLVFNVSVLEDALE